MLAPYSRNTQLRSPCEHKSTSPTEVQNSFPPGHSFPFTNKSFSTSSHCHSTGFNNSLAASSPTQYGLYPRSEADHPCPRGCTGPASVLNQRVPELTQDPLLIPECGPGYSSTNSAEPPHLQLSRWGQSFKCISSRESTSPGPRPACLQHLLPTHRAWHSIGVT